MSTYQNLPIFQKSYDAILRLQHYIDRMKRLYRYSYGVYLIRNSLDFLYLIVEVNIIREKSEKISKLKEADLVLQKLKIHTRLLHDLGSFNIKQYEVMSRDWDELGKQLGGWMKSFQ